MSRDMRNRFKILLVEYNPGDARLVERMLSKAGDVAESVFDIEWLQTAGDAVERLKKGGIDLSLPPAFQKICPPSWPMVT